MSPRVERVRWAAALAGPALFLGLSLLPLFGGGAKWRARCEGREFAGQWDDGFTDGLPVVELIAPLFALALTWMFVRFAFALWAPLPQARHFRWRLAARIAAADHWPITGRSLANH